MIDISSKSHSLRRAVALAVLTVDKPETIEAVRNKSVPKGDVFEVARTAGLLAIKRTAEMIPDCHPLPVEHAIVEFEINDLEIHITASVKAIYRTGVEMEALHGATIAALTAYDMLKPLDKEMEITSVKLLEKKGGKSDFRDMLKKNLIAAVIVSSDSVSAGKKEDRAGKVVSEKLKLQGIKVVDYSILPDEPAGLRAKVETCCRDGIHLIVITGGTGLSSRDRTPEAIAPLIEREVPGIMETARAYGQSHTPYAMLSRGLAGMRNNTLILAIPGSTRGASETMDALFPAVLHVFKVQEHEYNH